MVTNTAHDDRQLFLRQDKLLPPTSKAHKGRMAALALSKLTRSNYNGNKNAAVINNLVVISSKRRFCVVVAMVFFCHADLRQRYRKRSGATLARTRMTATDLLRARAVHQPTNQPPNTKTLFFPNVRLASLRSITAAGPTFARARTHPEKPR